MTSTQKDDGRRRSRTSTARRPRLGSELSAILAGLEALTSALEEREIAIDIAEFTEALAQLYIARPAPADEREEPRATLTNRAAFVTGAMEALGEQLDLPADLAGVLRRQLAAAHRDGEANVTLEEAIVALNKRSYPGERLGEAVIKFEAGRHLNLVKHQANRLVRSYTDYAAEELFGWGWKGLIVALRRYDPASWEFSTYACTRIVGHMQDGVRSESPLPKRLSTFERRVRRIEDELAQEKGRPASGEEIAEKLAVTTLTRELKRRPSVQEIAERLETERKLLALMPRLSVPRCFDDVVGAAEIPRIDNDPGSLALLVEKREAIQTALATLPPEEAEAVWLLDYVGASLEEAKEQLRATTRQLRSRRQRGRDRLSVALAEWR